MRTQSVILNLIPSGVNPVVHLSQYDQEDDGALLFNIYDGNVLSDLTGCTATIEGTKPDGTFYMYPCTVYSTYLTCAVNFQMTSIAGNYPAEVRINRGAENVGTINLTMMVEPAGVGRVDVSDTEIPSLLDDIETSVDEAEYWAHVAEHAVTGVASWNGRTGAVNPAAGDYDASQVDYDNSTSGSIATNTQDAIDERAPKKIITSNDAFDPIRTYAAGEWLIHQGVLYEVITACTGITPPNATYYEVKTLHDLQSEIDALNTVTTGTITKIGNYYQSASVQKQGNLCILSIVLSSSTGYDVLPKNTFVTIGTLPTGFRPASAINNLEVYILANGTLQYETQITVQPNGAIQAYNYLENRPSLDFRIVYFVS